MTLKKVINDTAYVSQLPLCNFCEENGQKVKAEYDGRTQRGPWANMCAVHFGGFGVGLGTGKGQRLIVGEKPVLPDDEKRSAIKAAIEAGDFDEAEDLIGDGDPAEWL